MAEDKAKKLLLIVNPVSGKKMAKRYMMKMINRFDEAGYSVTACCTQKNKNAYDITLSRGAGFDLIVCVGGDGTLKETVAGVMKLGIFRSDSFRSAPQTILPNRSVFPSMSAMP